MKIFKAFLEENGLNNIKPKAFTTLNAQMFSDYMVSQKYSAKTHNNKLTVVIAIFSQLKKRKLIDNKPFEDVSRKKISEGRTLFYDDKQKKTIKDHLIATESKLYLFVQFIFYCFIRPKELMLIQVKHINFDNKTVLVTAAVSKNHKNRIVPINDNLFTLIKKKYSGLDPETFLFSKGLIHGEVSVDRNRASEAHRKMLERIGISTEHKLYEWKHTGARLFMLSGRNVYDLMSYMGHASLDETMGYLRSLGVTTSKNKTNKNAWKF
jgi:integrase